MICDTSIYKLKVSGLRRCWDKRKIVTMNGLYDTRPRRVQQNTLILNTRWLYSPKFWDTCTLSFFAANFQLAKGGENMLNSTKAKGVAPALTHATTRDAESDYL